jgi:hypothetical protein
MNTRDGYVFVLGMIAGVVFMFIVSTVYLICAGV